MRLNYLSVLWCRVGGLNLLLFFVDGWVDMI